ncbi:MAG TPA: XRE family transcriptional regulator [Bacteroidetes bacterium]|nr:XRE family transcriptional regulator [Bacteroidota bacterium]
MNQTLKVLKEKGITQTWLAKQTGKRYPAINEHTRIKSQPGLEDLFKIADIPKVNVADLGSENMKNKHE